MNPDCKIFSPDRMYTNKFNFARVKSENDQDYRVPTVVKEDHIGKPSTKIESGKFQFIAPITKWWREVDMSEWVDRHLTLATRGTIQDLRVCLSSRSEDSDQLQLLDMPSKSEGGWSRFNVLLSDILGDSRVARQVVQLKIRGNNEGEIDICDIRIVDCPFDASMLQPPERSEYLFGVFHECEDVRILVTAGIWRNCAWIPRLGEKDVLFVIDDPDEDPRKADEFLKHKKFRREKVFVYCNVDRCATYKNCRFQTRNINLESIFGDQKQDIEDCYRVRMLLGQIYSYFGHRVGVENINPKTMSTDLNRVRADEIGGILGV